MDTDVTDVLPPIPQRVEKGIAWLEEQGAWDWAAKIVEAVERAEFKMTDCARCAIGVTLHDRGWAAWGDVDDPTPFGFALWVRTDRTTWADLEAEWERAARDRLAWLATIEDET